MTYKWSCCLLQEQQRVLAVTGRHHFIPWVVRVLVSVLCVLVLRVWSCAGSHITSDRRCLHGLVSWAHSHAEACRSCPDLQEVLEGQCRGALQVVWGCVDGHTYVMDTSGAQARSNAGPQTTETQSDDLQSASRARSGEAAAEGEAARETRETQPYCFKPVWWIHILELYAPSLEFWQFCLFLGGQNAILLHQRSRITVFVFI